MKTIWFAALVVIPAFLASGCGTMCNLSSRDPDVYGGVQKDVNYIQTPRGANFVATPSSAGLPNIGVNKGGPFLLALVLADTGLSLVGDTLTLPVVLLMRRGDPDKESE
jgi:uncharacterized protein YceK